VLFVLILINSLATALYVILSTKLVRHSGFKVSDVLAGSHVIASVGLAFIVSADVSAGSIDSSAYWLIGASVLLKACSKWLYFSALALGDVAPLSFMSALIPLIGAAFAYLFSGQTNSAIDIAGIIAAVSLLVFSLRIEHRAARRKSFITDHRAMSWTIGALSALANGISAVTLMMAVMRVAPPLVSFFNTALVAFIFMGYSARPAAQGSRGGIPFLSIFRLPELWLISLFFLLSHLTHTYLFTIAPVGLVLALERLNVSMQVILAKLILGENDNFPLRLLCAVAFMGITLLTEVLR
jgi:hypothetical protein